MMLGLVKLSITKFTLLFLLENYRVFIFLNFRAKIQPYNVNLELRHFLFRFCDSVPISRWI